jgi:predicted nucleotidyltransferase
MDISGKISPELVEVWTDREAGERKKDAADLVYLLENYERKLDSYPH